MTDANPQISIYEKVVEDEALELSLENRQKAKEARSKANAKFREVDELAKFRIGELELDPEVPVRVGRFVISKQETKPKSVQFETEAGTRLQISLLDE